MSTEQQVIRADSSDIRHKFEQWLAQEWKSGARLVIVEGLMKSGKSTLTKEPMVLFDKRSRSIELDQFLRRPVNPDTEYMGAIDIDAATSAISNAMTAAMVITEGPMAWPVTQRAREEVPPSAVRRVYLKRMAPRNSADWEELEFAQGEDKSRSKFFLSIERYHVRTRPWLAADMILERTGRDRAE
jgi:hypothetical protein